MSVYGLKILTLNCWGLPDLITKNKKKWKNKVQPTRTERFATIGERWFTTDVGYLPSQRIKDYDIVTLQEVWVPADREAIKEYGCRYGLIYSHSFASGIIGSAGLTILSKYPIIDAQFYRFRVNGQLIRIDHGDFHAGKGIGFARIRVSDDKYVALFTTHTIAQYNHTIEGDHYRADRLSQMWELGRYIKLLTGGFEDTSPRNHLVVVTGDFNCNPSTFEFQAFMKVLGPDFVDAYMQHASRSTTQLPKGHDITMEGENSRLDYIFYKKNSYWNLEHSEITMKDEHTIISDHYGVSATFKYLENPTTVERSSQDPFLTFDRSFIKDAILVIDEGIKKAHKRKSVHFKRALTASGLIFVAYWLMPFLIYLVPAAAGFAVFELVDGGVVIQNEVNALKQIREEMRHQQKS